MTCTFIPVKGSKYTQNIKQPPYKPRCLAIIAHSTAEGVPNKLGLFAPRDLSFRASGKKHKEKRGLMKEFPGRGEGLHSPLWSHGPQGLGRMQRNKG